MMRFGAGGEFADDRDVLGNRATNCGTGAGRTTPGRLRDRIDPASFKGSDETIRPGDLASSNFRYCGSFSSVSPKPKFFNQ